MKTKEKEFLLEHQELLEKYGIGLFLNDSSMITMPRFYRDIYIVIMNKQLTDEQKEELSNFTNKLLDLDNN